VDRPAVQTQTLGYAAISGMVDALGDTGHSRFLSPDAVKQEHNQTQGSFEGIGATVEEKDGHAVILAPLDGSPAQKAGLRPGDIILRVDGLDVSTLPLNEVVNHVLAPAGSTVRLTLQDPATGKMRDVNIVRARIVMHNVTWQRLPGTTLAHLRIAAFSQGISKDLQSALQAIRQQGLTGIVLDLRDDPGGLLDEAESTTGTFLTQGNVLLEKDAQGKVTPISVPREPVTTALPVVTLINAGTASAAEIVSGALHDAGRSRLVGQTTFGTGTVLQEFGLSDGSALLLATEEWLTPGGHLIWHQGIVPDQVVALPANVIPLVPEAEGSLSADQIRGSGDAQLLAAMGLLGAPAK